jgi:hypothetical protein
MMTLYYRGCCNPSRGAHRGYRIDQKAKLLVLTACQKAGTKSAAILHYCTVLLPQRHDPQSATGPPSPPAVGTNNTHTTLTLDP